MLSVFIVLALMASFVLIEQVEPCCFRLQSHEIGIFYFKIVFKGLTLFIDCFSPNDFDLTIVFDVLFSRLMQRFDDVQFFGSHRVADFVSWARALNGKSVRVLVSPMKSWPTLASRSQKRRNWDLSI